MEFLIPFLATVAVGLTVAFTFFLIFRTQMDPRVKELADFAYKAAAHLADLPARGSTPPVGLKDGAWTTRGANVVGNYKWIGAFDKVLWDRILIDTSSRFWEVLIHEMTHAVRRRNGRPSSEAAAYATRPLAAGVAPPNLAALLRRL